MNKVINLKIKLEETTLKKIYLKAAVSGLNIEELLENFIEDLVCGEGSNGSDERMYAEQWYERCGFSTFSDQTFLHYLIETYGTDEICDILKLPEEIVKCEEYIVEIKNNIKIGGYKEQGKFYSWREIWKDEGTQAYSSKEEWEQEEREFIEQEEELLACYKEEIKELWDEFVEWTDMKVGTMEEEMLKVATWHEEYQKHM